MLKFLRSIPSINKLIRKVLLNAGKTIISIQRKWRVSGNVELNFENIRFKMFSKSDDGIANALYYGLQYHEIHDLKVFLALVKENFTILDIGANTGLYSLVSQSKRNDLTIYSFEPNPINLKRLHKNISLNGYNSIQVEPIAIGASSEKIEFFIPENEEISDTSSAIKSFSEATYGGKMKWKSIQVEQMTLDQFVVLREINKIDLMKIDVEGYEIQVLSGAFETLKKFSPIILLESFLDNEKKAYFEKLVKELNYGIYLIHPEGIQKLNGSLTDIPGLNMLLCPEFFTESFYTLDALRKANMNTKYIVPS